MVKTAFNSYGAKLGAHNIKTGGVPIDMYAARSAGNRYGGVKSNIVAGCVPTGGVTLGFVSHISSMVNTRVANNYYDAVTVNRINSASPIIKSDSRPQSASGAKTGDTAARDMPLDTPFRQAQPQQSGGAVKTGNAAFSMAHNLRVEVTALRQQQSPSAIKTGNTAAGNMRSEAAYLRHSQEQLQGAIKTGNVAMLQRAGIKHAGLNDLRLEAKASFLETAANGVRFPQGHFGADLKAGGREIAGCVSGALGQQNDMGAAAASGIIVAGSMTYMGAKTLNTVASHASIKNIANTGIKTGNVALTAGKYAVSAVTTSGKATFTVVNTIRLAKQGGISVISKQGMSLLKSQAVASGLNRTLLSRNILNNVSRIKTNMATARQGFSNIKTGVVSTVSGIRTGAVKTVNIVRGVARGNIRIATLAKGTLIRAQRAAISGIKAGWKPALRGLTRGTAKGAAFAVTRGIPGAVRLSRGIGLGVAGALSSSGDTTLQGIGHAAKFAQYGIKTSAVAGKLGVRGVRTSVKAGIKTGKATVVAVKYLRKNGMKQSLRALRDRIGRGFQAAGRSVVNTIVNFFRSAITRFPVPLLLVLGAVMIVPVLSAPVAGVGAVFSGVFGMFFSDGSYEEFDIRDYLLGEYDGLPSLREKYIDELVYYIDEQLNGGYHVVRVYTNLDPEENIGTTFDEIDAAFMSVDDMVNIVQPIFNAVLLMNYDLSPTEEQARLLLLEIFNTMYSQDEEVSLEYCGQDLFTGEGEPDICGCGEIHAHFDCPNSALHIHSYYTCNYCCYFNLVGAGYVSNCAGHRDCQGHNVLSITLNMDGIYALLNMYFLEPIDELMNLPELTEEQEQTLKTLQDYYEICLLYLEEVNIIYGGGMRLNDLDGIEWVYGTRTGNSGVVELALSVVGQAGGQPFWSYYGFTSRVAWCACFTHWAYHSGGWGDDYGISANNAYCVTLANHFRSRGVFVSGNYMDLAIGDVIFFDWECDGKTDHVGLVIGRDEDYVYTVEGNSGDAVRVKCYSLNSSVIYGYAIFNS